MGIENIKEIDLAETILRQNGCRIQSFLASGETQYVVKKGKMSISPSFLSIRDVCEWVVKNMNNIGQCNNCWGGVQVKKPIVKRKTTDERLRKLEQIVKRQDQRIRELELEIKRLDLDEITEVEKLNKTALGR